MSDVMKPRSRTDASQLGLFKAQFSQILNPGQPLLILAEKIGWNRLDVALADCFVSARTLELRLCPLV